MAAKLDHLTLVLGGARSGKSRFAEALVRSGAGPFNYVATAEARDDEMRERIAAHRLQRGPDWITHEVPLALAETLAGLGEDDGTVLIDCLTLWLSNVMLAERNVEVECDRLIGALVASPVPVVMVANEVGLGIVPDNALARAFRDAHGRLNQMVAARADRVVLMVAGLSLQVKPGAVSIGERST